MEFYLNSELISPASLTNLHSRAYKNGVAESLIEASTVQATNLQYIPTTLGASALSYNG